MADAQSLFTPVMVLVLIPYLLTVVAMGAPASPLIVAFSFVPPFNSFLMLARLASDAPPPLWQVPVTIALGLVFVGFVLWFAAKVFKIGLLMHGKPPSFATLVRWARMA
jgi:ABC-2 type transport system permease protein